MDIRGAITSNEVDANKEFFTLQAPFIKFCQMQSHRMQSLAGPTTDIIRLHDYTSMGVPDLNIIIPVYGRENHLELSAKCLSKQAGLQISHSVNIIVCEMSPIAQHKELCSELGVEYLYIKSDMFNKSSAMTRAANLFPAEHFMFYDVDLLTGDGWLRNCLDTIKQVSSKSNCWVCQPIPGRKIFYIDEQDTTSLFSKEKTFEDLQQKDHYIQPEWYKGNYPPGGIILISANLLYAMQGYDAPLYWGYSPEDLFFLERCIQYSDFGDLISWELSEDRSTDVYHMYHKNSENTNAAYEHMVFAANVLKYNEQLSSWYSSDKLKRDSFPMWRQAGFNGSTSRFTESISPALKNIYAAAVSPEEFLEKANKFMEESFPDLKKINAALFKVHSSFISYLAKNGTYYFKCFGSL